MSREGEVAEFWGKEAFDAETCGFSVENAKRAVVAPGFEELKTMPLSMLQGDWRYYVPALLQEHWRELSLDARLAVLLVAKIEADDEAWT